ncbi:hypothetical protein PoB_007103200 [Plakobranchus ocellatus]|uniref:NodB homology domain-containing protein n=1 Tax=Plakobranchus ocellatus TaxID=259542 RepID=A0AAV4DKF5_9GAST|nr:hypothetical protein PoB_007103200 [Plakobranchus ocellatus]
MRFLLGLAKRNVEKGVYVFIPSFRTYHLKRPMEKEKKQEVEEVEKDVEDENECIRRISRRLRRASKKVVEIGGKTATTRMKRTWTRTRGVGGLGAIRGLRTRTRGVGGPGATRGLGTRTRRWITKRTMSKTWRRMGRRSVKIQACDWPHLADCSGHYHDSGPPHHGDADHDVGAHTDHDAGAHADHEVGTHADHEVGTHTGRSDHGQAASSSNHEEIAINAPASGSWINQAAAAGKSWWRPKGGLDSSKWQHVSSIKKPPFRPHVPDDDDSEEKVGGGSTADLKRKKGGKVKSSRKKETAPGKSKHGQHEGNSAVHGGSRSQHHEASAPANRRRSSDLQSGDSDCDPSSCRLPDCFCPGRGIPNGLPASSTPQMVMLTFDDEVSPAFYGFYQRLFRPGRYNPNGCPVRGCLFVSGSGTKYDLIYPLYAMGVEVASHSVSHRFPHTWWSSASYQDYVEEAAGMRDKLTSEAGVPAQDLRGFRVPFLQLGGDNMFGALYDNKFLYDSSMFTGGQWEGDSDPVWPFTLDYVPGNTFCQHGPCPTKQYPGLWEIPVQRWYGLDGHSCAMPDGCSATGDAEETLEYLKSNFRRYYSSNRAPMGVFIHARWFSSEHTLEGLDMFIDYLLTLQDVHIVTPSQVIAWMKNPTPLSRINNFQPWSCDGGANDVWLEAKK